MKTVTIKWIDLFDGFAKIVLWFLLVWNLWAQAHDVALVYGVVIIAWCLDDIATNTKVKKDE